MNGQSYPFVQRKEKEKTGLYAQSVLCSKERLVPPRGISELPVSDVFEAGP